MEFRGLLQQCKERGVIFREESSGVKPVTFASGA